MHEKLIQELEEFADWAHANSYEVPLLLEDDLTIAAYVIGKLEAEIEELSRPTLSQLRRENVQLKGELDRVKRERDAAVAELHCFTGCFICKHNTHKWLSDGKMDDLCKTCMNNDKCNWEWRGVEHFRDTTKMIQEETE